MDNGKLEIMQKTAERIKYLRTLKGMSQESLALSAGLNPAFLGHIERCIKCPTVDTLNKIASAMNVSLSELLNFDSDYTQKNSKAIERIAIAIRNLPSCDANRIAKIVDEIVKIKVRVK
jgi:Predicted transcriptional regulators